MPTSNPRNSRSAPQLTERQRAVAIAQHMRDSEGLTIAEIATRLGRSNSTVAGYFSDPAGDKAQRYKHKYRGRCGRCGTSTAAKITQPGGYDGALA
jgi:AraC-like DNA-binding protein